MPRYPTKKDTTEAGLRCLPCTQKHTTTPPRFSSCQTFRYVMGPSKYEFRIECAQLTCSISNSRRIRMTSSVISVRKRQWCSSASQRRVQPTARSHGSWSAQSDEAKYKRPRQLPPPDPISPSQSVSRVGSDRVEKRRGGLSIAMVSWGSFTGKLREPKRAWNVHVLSTTQNKLCSYTDSLVVLTPNTTCLHHKRAGAKYLIYCVCSTVQHISTKPNLSQHLRPSRLATLPRRATCMRPVQAPQSLRLRLVLDLANGSFHRTALAILLFSGDSDILLCE